MKVDIIQTSFAAGEFGPSLFGRTDIAQYANACAIVENMLPRPYGSAISMPGTRYVATVSDSSLKTRLIKFVFNRSDAYAIEMGDSYMRFFTDRGQVVTPSGTEDLSSYGANLKAHWKCNDAVAGTGTTIVLDAQTNHNGTASTITLSLTTTAIVGAGFNLNGVYHVSVLDSANFTRTASSQPMTYVGWGYYVNNGSTQAFISKTGEYELSINSSNKLSFIASSGGSDNKLLLHGDGTDGSTTITDSGSTTHTVTANDNAQIDTSQSKFGGASILFDGSGDYLSVPNHADFNFGTGDFTVDFWMRSPSISTDAALVGSQDMSNLVNGGFGIRNNGTNLQVYLQNTGVIDIAHGMSSDTWYHIALTRSGSNVYLFLNGALLASASSAANISTTQELRVGKNGNGAATDAYLNGWIDELRILKGQAAWTSAFTVPADAYQVAVTNTWQVNDDITEGWHLFGMVFNGDGTNSTHCKLYVDGMLKDLTFTADPSYVRMQDTSSLFRIGASSAAGAKNWKSKVDNIAFLHQELTAAQIAALYSSSAYQISTVFTENEVFAVHYTQLNDIIWLAHPNHPPQKLIRTSANEWVISDAPIIGGPFLDSNTDTSTTLAMSATTGTINITAATGKIVFTKSSNTLGHHNAFFAIGGLAQTNVTTGLQETGYVKITNVINSYTATATVIKNIKATTATAEWAEGAWSAVRGYPSRISIHERRLWFARTNFEPQKEWGSKTFEYENFTLDTQADDDALNLSLASNESNEIQWLASGKSLVAGTFGGAFVTNSGSTEPITPDNANASEEIGFGSDSIMPKKVGSFVYFIQRFGQKLRELFYSFDYDTYKASDRTILSPHILGEGVVDMDVQQNPESIIYCVLTSGTLATMTREADQEVVGWARHTTAGTYTSIAIIPSQSASYDEAWVIVERYVNGSQRKYVEFFENITVPSRQDKCLYLHSALSYDAYEATSMSSATISLSASSGSITLTSSTAYFTGSMVNKRLRAINASGFTIGEGTITATASTTSLTLSITTTFSALSYASGFWGISVSSVSGLSHLEAKTVGVLADGLTESITRTVASGVLTLGSNYWVVTVGLSYDHIIFTLPKEAGAQRGTAQGKLQRYNEISLKLNRSTQNFKYGPDASSLDDINMAFTPTITSLYTGILPPQGGGITMRGGYTRGAQIYLKNSNPLPIEILSIMGALDTNEK